jgi:hypothetical protein
MPLKVREFLIGAMMNDLLCSSAETLLTYQRRQIGPAIEQQKTS